MAVLAIPHPDPRQACRVWFRHAIAWTRFYKTSIMLNFVEPLTILLALGLGLGSYVHLQKGTSFLQFIAPGLISVTAMNAVSFDTLFPTFNYINENRVYPSMITSPLTVDDLVAGTMLWQSVRAVMYGGTFLLVVALFGLVHSWTALLVIPLLVLTGPMFGAAGMAVGAAVKLFEQMFYYITLVITPMFMFSGIFFPINRLPKGVQVAIWFTPLYHVATVARAFVSGSLSSGLFLDILWMLVFTCIMLLVPAGLIKRKLLV